MRNAEYPQKEANRIMNANGVLRFYSKKMVSQTSFVSVK